MPQPATCKGPHPRVRSFCYMPHAPFVQNGSGYPARTASVSERTRTMLPSPSLLATDWNEEWKSLQAARRPADDPRAWDQRAHHFKPRETHPYAASFLELARIEPGERVLDMGCGAGSLAIPLALQGSSVLACDFSPAMLDVLERESCIAEVADQIETKLLAWDDDWNTAGIADKSVDVAIASRSIATKDLKGALTKLDLAARRRCCITLVTGPSPHHDPVIMNAIGEPVIVSNDFAYAFAILLGMNRLPEITYIRSPRRDTFESIDEALAACSRMLDQPEKSTIARLRLYLENHLVPNPHAGEPGSKGKPQGDLMLDHIRTVTWAFISWNPVA